MIPVVLFYHQFVRQRRPNHYFLRSATTIDQFRAAMTHVKERCHPLGIEELVWIYRNGRRWPKHSVLITFDDGFKNNLWAAKILQELDMTGVFFVVSGTVGTRFQPWYLRFADLITNRKREAWQCSWGATDFRSDVSRRRWLKLTKDHLLSLSPRNRDAALDEFAAAAESQTSEQIDPDLEFFDADDLRQLQAMGMAVGGHSRTHDNLAACRDLRGEIVDSSEELAQHTGGPIRYFCYPDGRYNDEALAMVRGRFDAAFTTEARYTVPDLWRFPRRPGDGCPDVTRVLSPGFPARRMLIDSVKRVLKY